MVPKFGLKYKVNDSLMLRGTASQGFRAPSIPETGNGGASWFNNGYVDPKRCAAATALRDALNKGNAADQNDALTAYALGCSVSFPAAVTPNPGLKPEHTNSYTLGFVLQPIKQVSITLDYYNIKRRDEIAVQSVDETLANEDRIAGLVQRDPLTAQDIALAQRAQQLTGQSLGFTVGPIRDISAQYANLGKTRVSGLDLDVASKWQLGQWGRLNLGLELNDQFDDRGWDSFNNAYTENYVGHRGVPRTTAILKSSWEQGPWTTGARVNFTSATTLAWGSLDSNNTIDGCAARGVSADACAISSDTTVDFWGQYKGWKNTSVSMNIYNLFDRPTPVQLLPGGPLPLRGRSLMITAEFAF